MIKPVDDRVPWNRIVIVEEDTRPWCYRCEDHVRGPFDTKMEAQMAAGQDIYIRGRGGYNLARVEMVDHVAVTEQCSESLRDEVGSYLNCLELPRLPSGAGDHIKAAVGTLMERLLEEVWFVDEDTLEEAEL